MYNPFKKKNQSPDVSSQKMNFMQRLAMKKLEKMTPEEQMKMAQKMMKPENLAKNKDKILAVMEQMEKSGQITKEQAEMARKQFGI
jgi:hypothetical protein